MSSAVARDYCLLTPLKTHSNAPPLCATFCMPKLTFIANDGIRTTVELGAWAARLPVPTSMEMGMLEGVYAEQLPSSRLGCELVVSDELDGLEVRLPDRQI